MATQVIIWSSPSRRRTHSQFIMFDGQIERSGWPPEYCVWKFEYRMSIEIKLPSLGQKLLDGESHAGLPWRIWEDGDKLTRKQSQFSKKFREDKTIELDNSHFRRHRWTACFNWVIMKRGSQTYQKKISDCLQNFQTSIFSFSLKSTDVLTINASSQWIQKNWENRNQLNLLSGTSRLNTRFGRNRKLSIKVKIEAENRRVQQLSDRLRGF